MGLCYWRVCFKVKSLSCVHLFVSPWTIAHQASPSMGFSRQEYWSGLPFPSPGDLPHPGIEPRSPALKADALPSEPTGKEGLLTSGTYLPGGRGIPRPCLLCPGRCFIPLFSTAQLPSQTRE